MRKATINDPSFYEGYLYRLLSHVKIKEYDKALDLAEYIENLYPEKADAHAFRYFIFKEMGNSEEAKKERDLAKSMNPNLDIQQRSDCMKQKELKFDIEKINDMKKS